jgi:hypothetical protein
VPARSPLVKGATTTATVGAGSQETLAAPPVPATAAQPWVEEAERRRQLLQALTTEHFTLFKYRLHDWPRSLGARAASCASNRSSSAVRSW